MADSVVSEPLKVISVPVPSLTVVLAGAVRSMVIPSAVDTEDTLPAASVARTLR